jgi:hypothetical protein
VADEWTHEDDLRPALAAIVEELAAALQVRTGSPWSARPGSGSSGSVSSWTTP